MSNQIVISSGAKLRGLNGVITGTTGVLDSVPLGAANGVATLDSSGKVPVSQLPSSVVTYLGTWNAATNTPTLVNGTGDAGDMYLCNVAGTVNFGAGPITFAVGDWVLYGSGTWQKSNGQNGTVTSVAVTESGDALSITGSPITTSGTINIGFAGTSAQYVAGDGSLITFPSLAGFVPYTGATGAVNLGAYDLTVNELTIGKGTSGLSNNTALGHQALFHITTGNYNTGVGHESLHNTSTGAYNTAIGQSSLFTNTTGGQNTALGLNALLYNTTGSSNVAVGVDTMQHNTTGASNTALGYNAGSHITNGSTPNTTASNSVYIGRDSKAKVDGGANEIVIGYNAIGNGSNTATFGNTSTTANYFTGSINGGSFVKSGGTSSQFLKADGSVDSSTYLTTSAAASTYLPLTGGTLSGLLTISTASYLTSRLKLTNTATGGNIWSVSSGNANNSTNNGLFSIINETLGKNIFSLSPTGNIIIGEDVGTANPAYNLQVIGTNTVIKATDITGNNSNATLQATNSAAYLTAGYATTAIPLIFQTGNTTRLTLAATGEATLTGALNGTSATFSGSVTIEGANSLIKSGNELRFYRTDNAIYTRLYDAGTYFALDNRNGNGFDFQSAGTSQMRITSAGNVGIGTTTPAAYTGYITTQISGTAGGGLYVESTTASMKAKFYADNGTSNAYIGTETNHSFSIRSNNTDRLTIASTGAATFTSSVKTGAGLNVTGYTNSSGANYWEIGSDTSGYYMNAINRSSGNYNQPAYIDAQKLIINSGSGGNVGIGTSSPVAALTVFNNSSGIRLQNSSTGTANTDGADIFLDGTDFFVRNIENGFLGFATNNAERARITSAGSLLVGRSTNPYESTYKFIVKNTTDQNIGFGLQEGELSIEAFNDAINSPRAMRLYANKFSMLGGNVLIGNTSSVGSKLIVKGDTSNSSTYSAIFWNSNSADLFYVRNDGLISTGTTTLSPYNFTTGTGANLVVDASGFLYRSTSSLKYKTNITDYDKGLDIITKMKPVYYNSKNNGDTLFAGLIAEDIHELGLTEFVQYAEDGSPDALSYSNMVALLIKGMQEQQKQIEELKLKIK